MKSSLAIAALVTTAIGLAALPAVAQDSQPLAGGDNQIHLKLMDDGNGNQYPQYTWTTSTVCDEWRCVP